MARDIYAEMLAAQTQEEFNSLAKERAEKEADLKASGQWDLSWIPTADIVYGVEGFIPGAYEGETGVWHPSASSAGRSAAAIPNPYSQISLEMSARLANQKAAQKSQLEDYYRRMTQNAYIQKMQDTAALPGVLAAAGRTGGLAESTAMAPQLAYGNLLKQLEQEKLAKLSEIDRAADEQELSLALGLAEKTLAQANADRSFAYAVQQNEENRLMEEEDRKYDRAWTAAAAGDFSLLKSLGIDTAAMESEAAAAAKKTTGSGTSRGSASPAAAAKAGEAAAAAGTSDRLYKNAVAMIGNGASITRVADYLLDSAEPELAAQYMEILDLFGGVWEDSQSYASLEKVVQNNIGQGKSQTAADLIAYWYKLGDISRLDAIRMLVQNRLDLGVL